MRFLFLALESALLLSCSPRHGQAYERALTAADGAETRGQYGVAARDFDEAASRALLERDRTHATYLAALMYEKAGDLSSARDRYEALARSVPPAEDSGAAAYKEADMDIARGDPRLGWREMGAMLFRFPNDGLGKSALHRILRHEDETDGPLATLAFLRENASRLESTERAEEVAYEIASRLEELGKLEEARDDFVHMAARWRYPVGALWDDALYRAAVIDERLGRPKSALADLDALLSQQETSILSGSYTRPRYPQAAMFAARIWRDDLHDAATARQMFHAAYANFPSWGERDQALWSEAELWSAEHRSDEECATLSALTRQFPDSRYVPCAALRCSNVKRAPASRAPTSCHPYIEVDKSSP